MSETETTRTGLRCKGKDVVRVRNRKDKDGNLITNIKYDTGKVKPKPKK